MLARTAPVLPGLCAHNVLGTSECEYVAYGKWDVFSVDFECCAHGFTDPDPILQPVQRDACDTNVLHSSYG